MELDVSAGSWPEAVFHVLAHVDVAAPSSIFAPWYVQFAEQALGPAAQRTLQEDARVLARLANDHLTLSKLQLVAWSAHGDDNASELLRCAVALEADAVARLPQPNCDLDALRVSLTSLHSYAPKLIDTKITLLRPLTHHGRVRGNTLWLGVPGHGTTLSHVSIQAAHEATVREVQTSALAEREVEAVALVLLAARMRGSAFEDAHRAWCTHWRVRSEHLDPANLSAPQRAVLAAMPRG